MLIDSIEVTTFACLFPTTYIPLLIIKNLGRRDLSDISIPAELPYSIHHDKYCNPRRQRANPRGSTSHGPPDRQH